MAVRFGRIELTIGTDRQIKKRVVVSPATNPLAKGWLTVKSSAGDADPGVFQKVVTTAFVAGQGQVTDDGSVDGVGEFSFELTVANTSALSEGVRYEYDVQAKQADGKVFMVERGTVIASRRVTQAAS